MTDLHWAEINSLSDLIDYLHGGTQALGTAIGAVVALFAFWTKWIGSFLIDRFDKLDKQEKALRAVKREVAQIIRDSLAHYSEQRFKEIEQLFADAQTKNEKFIPFGTFVVDDTTFELIKPLLVEFEGELADKIVFFYQTGKLIEQSIADMRSPQFAGMSLERQKNYTIYFFELGKSRNALGRDVIGAIDAKLQKIMMAQCAPLVLAAAMAVTLSATAYGVSKYGGQGLVPHR